MDWNNQPGWELSKDQMDLYSLNLEKQVLFRNYDADNDYFRINNLSKFSKELRDEIFLSNDQASEFVAEYRKQEFICWQRYEGKNFGPESIQKPGINIENKSPADPGSLEKNETITKIIKKSTEQPDVFSPVWGFISFFLCPNQVAGYPLLS